MLEPRNLLTVFERSPELTNAWGLWSFGIGWYLTEILSTPSKFSGCILNHSCVFTLFMLLKPLCINRRLHFTPVRAEVIISFEKLTDEPSNLGKKFSCCLEKLLKSKTVAACHVQSQGLFYMWIQWNDLWKSMCTWLNNGFCILFGCRSRNQHQHVTWLGDLESIFSCLRPNVSRLRWPGAVRAQPWWIRSANILDKKFPLFKEEKCKTHM